MIFTDRPLKVTIVTPKDPIAEFLARREALGSRSCQVLFNRYIGMMRDETSYVEMIRGIDKHCSDNGIMYCRVSRWKVLADFSKIELFTAQYAQWEEERTSGFKQLSAFPFPLQLSDSTLNWTQKKAFQQIFALYRRHEPNLNESKQKNFFVKFFGWIHQYIPLLYRDRNNFPKVVFYGDIKLHEYLFLYFLALLGCDVLYFNAVHDAALPGDLLALSVLHNEAVMAATLPRLPSDSFVAEERVDRPKAAATPPVKAASAAPPAAPPMGGKVNIAHPQRGAQPAPPTPQRSPQPLQSDGRELDYEALAQLAISIVKIKVYDEKKEVRSTGSGVVFNTQGYIVTNLHVVAGGTSYGIQYENEEQEYCTEVLVKYHPVYDLAILKVDRRSNIIAIYDGAPLKRGQKIVAIGSPLGLFNSISDGIISGFREIDDKSMIQFTAPISPGSSGGALLDLQGRLVGVITCHFTEGQNLNLAVDFSTLRSFIGNLLPTPSSS